MELTHDEMKANLAGNIGKAFVKDLTHRVYDWSDKVPAEYYNYRVFEELTIRYETGEKTRKHLDKTKHYRQDAVLFIEPGWAAVNQRCCYTVGVELKGNLKDLTGDKKLENYIGWNDLFFIGCTEEVIPEAMKRAEESDFIGVFSIENGFIYKLPKRCQVSPFNKLWMYEQIMYNTVFNEMKTINFKTEEIVMTHPELVDITPKIHPEYNNLSNNDTINVDNDNISNIDRLKMEEEKAARKAAAQARQEFRQRRAAEMAEKAQQMPEDVRLKLSALSDGAQAAYHILRKNPGMTAIGLEKSMGVGEATARRFVASLTESGLIEHQGSKKSGGYHPTLSDEGLKMAMPKCNTCILFKTVKFNNHESTDRNSSGI